MTLKIKRLTEDAVLPIRAHKGDAGIDLTCTNISQELNECGQLIIRYHTGLAVEIPEGYVGYVFPRSSIYKKSLLLCNAVGVIDAGYRGEIMAMMRNTTDVLPAIYKPGERFAQLIIMPIPEVEIEEVAELSKTDRGEGGFGSTGVSAVPDDTTDTPDMTDEVCATPDQDATVTKDTVSNDDWNTPTSSEATPEDSTEEQAADSANESETAE